MKFIADLTEKLSETKSVNEKLEIMRQLAVLWKHFKLSLDRKLTKEEKEIDKLLAI
jgi:hypothetical protein